MSKSKTRYGVILLSSLMASAAGAQAPALRQAADPGNAKAKELASNSAQALVRGDDQQAAVLAEKAEKADDRNPWAHYDRAVALGDLRLVDDAVAEYAKAEQRFSAADTWGKSVALYGRALLLAQHGRCEEAKAGFQQYITFVGAADPAGVVEAQTASVACQQGSSLSMQPTQP